MGYQITRVQRRSMNMICDIYAPDQMVMSTSGSGKLVEGLFRGPENTPTIANVPCRIESTPDVDEPIEGLGSSNVNQMDTTDRMRLPYLLWMDSDNDATTPPLIEPGDGWVIHIKTGASAANGIYYTLQGGPQGARVRGMVGSYLAKRTQKPPFVS